MYPHTKLFLRFSIALLVIAILAMLAAAMMLGSAIRQAHGHHLKPPERSVLYNHTNKGKKRIYYHVENGPGPEQEMGR